MIKKYRLSIEITCDVNESVQGIPDREVKENTHEILQCLLANPQLPYEYYRSITAQNWLCGHLDKEEWEGVINNFYRVWDCINLNHNESYYYNEEKGQ
jgi:hypothetical protein